MSETLTPQSDHTAVAAAYQSQRVLITGGAGCIGSNLCCALLQAGAKHIVVLDNLSASARWNLPRSERLTFLQGSVTDPGTLALAMQIRPTIVFHLAALFANQNSLDHPEEDLRTNGLGTLRVLEAARQAGAGRVVYTSSGCSVYDSSAPLPFKEDYVSLHLNTPYQITKLLGELYANFFHSHHHLLTVCARLFNVYGPGEAPGRYRNVIPNFFYRALRGEPLPITGTGEETRDFTYVGDVVNGLLRCGVLPQAAGQTINLASGTETTVRDLATQINNLTGSTADVRYQERRPWDHYLRRRASIEKAQRLLGYRPGTSLEDGLKHTLEWFHRHSKEIEEAVSSRSQEHREAAEVWNPAD